MDCSMVSVLRFITVSETPVMPSSVSTRSRTQLRKPRFTMLVLRSVIFTSARRLLFPNIVEPLVPLLPKAHLEAPA